jgi:hypothetical protein
MLPQNLKSGRQAKLVRQKSGRRAIRASLEMLERRPLRSISTIDAAGVVSVIGTSGNDTITVGLQAGNSSMLDVTLNGVTDTYSLAAVKQVDAIGGAGNDLIQASTSNGSLTLPLWFQGNTGADTLIGDNGPDTLQAGRGPDFLETNGSDNLIYGGRGSDQIIGSNASDSIFGGLGSNTIAGTGATDSITAGGGVNSVNTAGVMTPFYQLSSSGVTAATYLGSVIGYSPDQIRAAYGLPALSDTANTNLGQGQTIGIVDPYGNPNIVNDLTVFSQEFGLPLPTSSNFQVVYPDGTPGVNDSWALEADLDVEWAHAIAPDAKIVMVNSLSAYDFDTFRAVNIAGDIVSEAGGGVVAMSFGELETGGSLATNLGGFDTVFQDYPTVSFIAASGDTGGVVSYPASSPYVTGVGATTLPLDSDGNRIGDEQASAIGGGGLSTLYTQPPSFQSQLTYPSGVPAVATVITARAVPDVAWDGDPTTPEAIFDSLPIPDLTIDGSATIESTGWTGVGGTSQGAPAWAAFIALVDQERKANGNAALGITLNQEIYSAGQTDEARSATQPLNFNDITVGPATLVNDVGIGYDLATGLGTPNCSVLEATLVGSDVPYAAGPITWTADYYPAYAPSLSPEVAELASGTGSIVGGDQLILSFVENTTTQWQPATDTNVAGPTLTFNGGTDPDTGVALAQVQLNVAPNGYITGYGDYTAAAIAGTAVPPVNDPSLEFAGTETVTANGVAHGEIQFWTIDGLGNKVSAGPFQAHAADVITGEIKF